MKKLIFFISALILLCGYIFAYPTDDAYEICGKDYFPEVKRLIEQAKKSIYITMYIATYFPDYPESVSNQLLRALARAQKRGVNIRVILDQERPSAKGQYNDLAYFFLKDAEIQVDYDIPSVKLHDKLMIIDEYIIVMGSHNWSKSALKGNREASVVIKSPGLAQAYLRWIRSTPIAPRRNPPPRAQAPNIYLPYQFLTNPRLGSKLSDMRMLLYLYLLMKWEENGRRTITLDYYDCAKFIGVEKQSREYYRKNTNKILRVLQDKFKLISFKTEFNKPAEIDLVDYNDKKKIFSPDPKNCFIIPGSFFEFGWVRRLSLSAKYFYFISLIETGLTTDPKGWWTHGQEYLSKKYHVGLNIISDGVLELNRYNLLAVQYGILVFPFTDLSAPKYLLLPLYSWEWHEEQMEKMKELYGKEKVEKARRWAEVVLEENNLDAIEKLINYSNEYGEGLVQFAVDKVSKKRIGNPKRSFAYVEGIILKEYRDQQEEPED